MMTRTCQQKVVLLAMFLSTHPDVQAEFSGESRLSAISKLEKLGAKLLRAPEPDGRVLQIDISAIGSPAYSVMIGNTRHDVDDTRPSDYEMYLLGNIRELQSVVIGAANVTNEGIKHLSILKDVEEIQLSADKIDDRGVAHLSNLKKLKRLSLQGTKTTGKCFENFLSKKAITILDLSNTHFDDEGLNSLRGFCSLERLDLSRTRVTDRGMRSLSWLLSLKRLSIWHVKLGDDSLKHFSVLANLEELELAGNDISGTGLEFLKKLEKLKLLGLAFQPLQDRHLKAFSHRSIENLTFISCPIGNHGLPKLAAFPCLTSLVLAQTNVSSLEGAGLRGTKLQELAVTSSPLNDEGASVLTRLPSLRSLELCNTEISDVFLEGLSTSTSLRRIDVRNHNISSGAVEQLRHRLPCSDIVGPE